MEYRNLYVTLISATGLKEVNKFRKMDVYAKAYLHGYKKTKKKTKPDKNCGTSPTWNHQMQFIIDEHSLTVPGLALDVHIKAEVVGKDKEIGEVSVPIPQLFDDCGKTAGVDRLMDYEVKTPSGKLKGTLKLSCLFGEKYRLNFSCDGQPSPGMVNAAYHDMMGCHYPGVASPSGASHNGYAARYPSKSNALAHPRSPGVHGAISPSGGQPQQAPSNGCGVYAPAPSPGYAATAASGYVYCQQHQATMQDSNDQQQPVQDTGGKKDKKKSKMKKFGGGLRLGESGADAGSVGGTSVCDSACGVVEAIPGAGSVGGTSVGDSASDVVEVISGAGSVGGMSVGDSEGDVVEAIPGADEMLAGDMISSAEEMISGVGETTTYVAGEMVDGGGELAKDAMGDMATDGEGMISGGEAGEAISSLGK